MTMGIIDQALGVACPECERLFGELDEAERHEPCLGETDTDDAYIHLARLRSVSPLSAPEALKDSGAGAAVPVTGEPTRREPIHWVIEEDDGYLRHFCGVRELSITVSRNASNVTCAECLRIISAHLGSAK